jgi:hypothetical protein
MEEQAIQYPPGFDRVNPHSLEVRLPPVPSRLSPECSPASPLCPLPCRSHATVVLSIANTLIDIDRNILWLRVSCTVSRNGPGLAQGARGFRVFYCVLMRIGVPVRHVTSTTDRATTSRTVVFLLGILHVDKLKGMEECGGQALSAAAVGGAVVVGWSPVFRKSAPNSFSFETPLTPPLPPY